MLLEKADDNSKRRTLNAEPKLIGGGNSGNAYFHL
jgi:hypothetical protein